MHEFAAQLDAALHELGSPDADATAIARSPVVRESRPRPVRARRSRWPLVLSLLALLAAAAVLAGVLALGGSKGKKHPARAGGGAEHPEAVARATDGNPTTYWYTEHYRSFSKRGVGLVLDAGRSASLRRVTLTSDGGGFQAQIQTGDSHAGAFK